MKALLTLKHHVGTVNTKSRIKPTAVREKQKQNKFSYDSVPELNTKKLGNSPIYLTNTHKTVWKTV
jgi:hypothetical protein